MVCDIRTVLAVSTVLSLTMAPKAMAADAVVEEAHLGQPPVGATEVPQPSLEFLEFLGQWETDDGEWIAPEELADENFVDLIESALTADGLTGGVLDTGLDTDDSN